MNSCIGTPWLPELQQIWRPLLAKGTKLRERMPSAFQQSPVQVGCFSAAIDQQEAAGCKSAINVYNTLRAPNTGYLGHPWKSLTFAACLQVSRNQNNTSWRPPTTRKNRPWNYQNSGLTRKFLFATQLTQQSPRRPDLDSKSPQGAHLETR